MQRILLLFQLIFTSSFLFAQHNLGFEEYKNGTDTLLAWNRADGQSIMGGVFRIDKEVKHSGKQSLSIERTGTDSAFRFTPVSFFIPVQFEGKKLTVRCWLRTENVSTSAQMWLRVDDAGKNMLSLVNYPTAGINGNQEWTQYSTTIDLHENASFLYVGFLLVGSGKVWADDFSLDVDNKPIETLAFVERPVLKALLDNKQFVKNSEFNVTHPDIFQIENLSLLGKVWGFLKYYHPHVAGGNVNWDYELFRILPRYSNVQNLQERNAVLLEWIRKWPLPQNCKTCSDKLLTKATVMPDLDWMKEKDLGDSLISLLDYIRQNRHQGKQFYMNLHPGVINPEIRNEASYQQFTYPDAGYRLLSLFRYWNLIQYWFPNRHLIGEDWKQVLTEFVPKMLASPDALAYTRVTQELIARIHDTHANIWGNNKLLEEWKGSYYPPFVFQFVGDTAVVSRLISDSRTIQKGDVILAVNGEPMSKLIREHLPNLPASNYPTQLRDLSRYLLRGKDSVLHLTVSRNGNEMQIQVIRHVPATIAPWYQPDFQYQKDSAFFFVQPSIAYLNLGKVKSNQVDSIFHALKGSQGLIIDNRQYPSDFPLYRIAEHLVPEKVPFTLIPVPQLAYPGAFVPKHPLFIGKSKNKNYYKGKVVILVNENTQSSGEFHSMAFRLAPGATILGSTTAGADGNVSGFFLPGGIYTMFSGIGILYPDGTETQRVGIVPDVEVKRTVQGIHQGRDELLEQAVDQIKSGGNGQFQKKAQKLF